MSKTPLESPYPIFDIVKFITEDIDEFLIN
jgi:hypothetical protein